LKQIIEFNLFAYNIKDQFNHSSPIRNLLLASYFLLVLYCGREFSDFTPFSLMVAHI